jgi:ribosomal protein S8E
MYSACTKEFLSFLITWLLSTLPIQISRYQTLVPGNKQRHGAKVTKKYDAGSTPHQRAIGHESMQKWAILGMNAEFKGIKPATLSRHILALTGQLETLALASIPAAIKPSINRAWNS